MKKHDRAEIRMFQVQPPRCECGKIGYDKKGAQTAANLRMKLEHKKLRIYNCPYTVFWHLTKQL